MLWSSQYKIKCAFGTQTSQLFTKTSLDKLKKVKTAKVFWPIIFIPLLEFSILLFTYSS